MRKIISLFVALTLLTTIFAGSAMAKPGNGKGWEKKQSFSDIENHWGKGSIIILQVRGLFNGYEDGTFRPENLVTQAEVAVLVDRLVKEKLDKLGIDYDDEDEVLTEDDQELKNVPGWAKKSVKKGLKNKYINLKRFNSQVQCDRLTACVQIAKALGLDPVTLGKNDVNPFKDSKLMSDEDFGYILALYKAGYVKGYPDGKFNPNRLVKRAEMAAILERFLEDKDDDDLVDKTAPTWPADSELKADKIGAARVVLSWTAAKDNEKVTGYKITYELNGVDKEKLVGAILTATISDLEADEEYEFTVEARDAAGNWSGDGPSLIVTTKEADADEESPTWPANAKLAASDITDSAVTLEWPEALDNVEVTQYRLYQNGSLIETLDADGTSITIASLEEDTDYTFKVKAGDAKGNWSETLSVKITTEEA